MKSISSMVLAALALSAQAYAAPLATETRASQISEEQAENAFAQVCLRNSIENRRVGIAANWGVGDRWTRLVLRPGDEAVFRLVMPQTESAQTLKVRYYNNPGTNEVAEDAVAAVWSETRSNDCADLPRFAFVLQEQEDGTSRVALVAEAEEPGEEGGESGSSN